MASIHAARTPCFVRGKVESPCPRLLDRRQLDKNAPHAPRHPLLHCVRRRNLHFLLHPLKQAQRLSPADVSVHGLHAHATRAVVGQRISRRSPPPQGLLRRHNGPMASLLAQIPHGIVAWGLLLTCMACGLQTLYLLLCRKPLFCFNAAVATTLVMLWFTAGGVLPVVLGAKSDRPVAQAVDSIVPRNSIVYSWVGTDMLRYYTINFYLDDRLRVLDTARLPRSGYLLIGETDIASIRPQLIARGYNVTQLLDSHHRSCDTRQTVLLFQFSK